MDFHSLSRRELQALCKRNKIPANITNVAMADALKALDIVEGLGEFSQLSQSETGQSYIDSVDGSEVTSPYVTSTAVRSTRRRNVTKEDPEAVTSMTGTRQTTRKTAVKVSAESQVDTLETPALRVPTSRRKVQTTSVCWKMDSQLKECAEEEEKKDALMTPAPLGTVHRYSTRRSVRLAEKSVHVLNNEKVEDSKLFKNELFAKNSEDQEVNLKECLQETSGINVVDAIVDMEESYDNKEESEVESAEQQDITVGDLEVDNTATSEEVKQSEGSVDVCASEIETMVENSKEMDIEIDASPQDAAGDSFEHAVDVCKSETETTIENSKEMDIEIDVAGDSVEHVLLESKVEEEAETDEMETHGLEEEAETDEIETGVKGEAGSAIANANNSPSKQLSGVEDVPSAEPLTISEKTERDDSQADQLMKDSKPAKCSVESLNDMSLTKLTKMLKEKLQITKKPGAEATVPRPVLQPLPENPLI